MFKKIVIIAGAGLMAVVSLSAGSVQLGEVSGGVNYGLTTAYMTSGVGSIGTSTLSNYDTTLFSNSTNGVGNPPSPFIGYSNTAGVASTPGSTMVQGTITFDMISQTGNDGNYWDLIGESPRITIPAGVFGVQTVWMMMNNAYGDAGVNNTNVTFTFDNAANGSDAGSLNTLTVSLLNGTEIRDAVLCTSGGNCTSLTDAKTIIAVTSVSPTIVTGSGPATINVAARNVYSSVYNAGSTFPYDNTTGSLVLDDQGFAFGNTFASQYLVSVGVTDNSGVANVSNTAVSAVTLTTNGLSPVPEPASVFLFVAGVGVLGLVRRKRLQRN